MGARSIFLGPNGIRAGWRLLIFIALTLPLVFVVQSVAKLFPALKAAVKVSMQSGTSDPLGIIVLQISVLLPILLQPG